MSGKHGRNERRKMRAGFRTAKVLEENSCAYIQFVDVNYY